MKVKFRYNSDPVYSKKNGRAANVEFEDGKYLVYFSKGVEYYYSNKGVGYLDKLYCVVPFKYSKLYSFIILTFGLIICSIWAETAYFEPNRFYSFMCIGYAIFSLAWTLKVLLRIRKSRKDYINYEQL